MSTTTASFKPAPLRPHERIRTFSPRRTPMSGRHEGALVELWPRFGFSVHDPDHGPAPLTTEGRLDTVALFGRNAPVVLEIGFGMGETTAAMAAADPARNYVAVEAHVPGVASLLARIADKGLTNVRVAHGDALDLVAERLPLASLDAVHIFFPDPWPKSRHHKRRIIQSDHVALVRSRLVEGGTLHCATDWATYAEVMLEVLGADPELTNSHRGFAPRPAHRPVTKFERRGIALGHDIFDIIVTRSAQH